MNKKNSIIVGAVAIILAVILFIAVGRSGPAEDNGTATTTPSATGSSTSTPATPSSETSASAGTGVTVPVSSDVEEAIKKALADAMQSANTARKAPTIATSPYTIYLGFATDYGTSSKDHMDRESREVVVGYEWESLGGSPEITMVKLPLFDIRNDGDETEYGVQAFDEKTGAYVSLGEFRSGEEIRYVREGSATMRKFKVEIPSTLRICPGDRGFSWTFRFANGGDIGVVRTPITERLPGSETCVMR